MNHLPLEVNLEISSYLSLNQLADCRLVSHSFKAWAEATMQLITHVRVEPLKFYESWVERVEEGIQEPHIRHTFLSKRFVMALVETRGHYLYCAGSNFYAFLGKFCPNLQVLQMERFRLSYEDLALLAPNLQFFISRDFSPKVPPSSRDQFPNLQGYMSYSDYSEYCSSLNKMLLQLNRPVCVLRRGELDKKTVKLLARGGTKCLHFFMHQTNWVRFSLSQPLAESLVELSVDFIPAVTFCSFTLPNLLYLTINRECPDSTERVAAPNLRCLTWKGDVAAFGLKRVTWKGDVVVDNLSYLMDFINSFSQLRVLSLFPHYDEYKKDDDEDEVAHQKLKISLPTSLEKLTFKTSVPFELVDHSSTSLKYLVAEKVSSFSFAYPSLKVLIYRRVGLDSASLSRLLHSLSHCVKLAKLVLQFSRIPESVSLQPLIDLLSTMTGLSHLELYTKKNNSPPDSILFEQKKFPSLVDLDLRLLQAKIVFHPTNSFSFFERKQFQDCSSLELRGSNKIYLVKGRSVEVLSNEKLDKTVELILREDLDSSEPIVHDSKTIPWLLGLVGSRVNSGEAELGGAIDEETALNVVLPPQLGRLSLHLVNSLDSLRLSSSTLQSLSISHVRQLRFDLPSLRKIGFRNWLEPLDATVATHLNGLTSMSFYFDSGKEPSFAVIEGHFKLASKLKQLATLKFSSFYSGWRECLGCVRIRQEDLPSVKKFIWTIPVSFEFYPEDKFTKLIISYDSLVEFRNEEKGCEYKFDVRKILYTWSIELPQSGMAQLSQLHFSSALFVLNYLPDDLYLQIMALTKCLTQVNHIRIYLYESVRRSETKSKARTDAILEWLSSLTTLSKLEGYMSPSLLHQFLHQTRTAGPIELVTFKHMVSWEDYQHLYHHQQIMNELMGRKVISKFSHPAQCSCQIDCFIKANS